MSRSTYTAADIAAWAHFGAIGRATEKVFGENLVLSHIPEAVAYLDRIEERPHVKKLAKDREAAIAEFFAWQAQRRT